jgi:hypothetical protein
MPRADIKKILGLNTAEGTHTHTHTQVPIIINQSVTVFSGNVHLLWQYVEKTVEVRIV